MNTTTKITPQSMKKFTKSQLTKSSQQIIKATKSYNKRLLYTQLHALNCILFSSDFTIDQTDAIEK